MGAQPRGGKAAPDHARPYRPITWLALTTMLAVDVVAGMSAPTNAEDRLFDANRPLEIADQGVFSIPGRYVEVDKRTVMVGQMFVQYQIPKNKTRPYPVVMIHGGGQTASNFLGTPDGRRGWADDFVANGYAVYVVDQSGRGRSGFFGDSYGKTRKPSVENVEQRFTAPERKQLWPQASLHSQWPGAGTKGDATFDAFYASQVETIGDEALIEQINREAGAKLLDRIGPAVLLTHSQAGVNRLERCRRAATARERHSLGRAQRPPDPRNRRQGGAGLFRGRRDRAPLGRHAREDRIRSSGADAGRAQARAAG